MASSLERKIWNLSFLSVLQEIPINSGISTTKREVRVIFWLANNDRSMIRFGHQILISPCYPNPLNRLI